MCDISSHTLQGGTPLISVTSKTLRHRSIKVHSDKSLQEDFMRQGMRQWTRYGLIVTAFAFCALLVTGGIAALAEDEEAAAQEAPAMPEMGPPEEIQEMDWIVGEWKVTGKLRMDPTQDEWVDYEAVCTYDYTVDGGALEFDYQSEMMGMPMVGYGLQTYNRETGKWQSVWVDNFGCNLYYMEGEYDNNGELVMNGSGTWQGREFLSRLIISNETETSFDWRMEDSYDGGQNYATTMKATYTKAE
ncbi:DUF1579 domain-containing protein [candidate division GN15 bacterium]|nr:DUF1579 domain-containing protein [candidate division GN15 bacterium]